MHNIAVISPCGQVHGLAPTLIAGTNQKQIPVSLEALIPHLHGCVPRCEWHFLHSMRPFGSLI